MENKKEKRALVPLEIIALVFVFFAFLFFRGSINVAWGGGNSSNVAGWAWSSNFGWASFNCDNPPYPSTCGISNYGVKINPSGNYVFNFEGYAWSANAGWISFNETGAPDYSFNAYCESFCDSSSVPPCTACYSPYDGKIYGWAKVLSFGDNGWINLRGTTTAGVEFGVSIDQDSASGTFNGWAWNGNTEKGKGLGWLSFDCHNPEVSSCGSSDYSVHLASSHLPVPINLSAPNYSTTTACALQSALGANLGWVFSDQDADQTQLAYQVIMNDQNVTSSPLLDTGKVIALDGPFQQVVTNAGHIFDYFTRYYWWVRVWDSFGFRSRWVQFDTNTPGHVLTDNRPPNANHTKTFTTYYREFPLPYFSRVPKKPIADAPVTTTDRSFYSLDADPSVRHACDEDHCQWLWSSTDALTISSTTASSTVMTFPYNPAEEIFLKVTDNGLDNYSCVTSTVFKVDKLPIWIEKKAE